MHGLAVALVVSVVCNVCLYFARGKIEPEVRRRYPRCKLDVRPYYLSCGFDVEKDFDFHEATKRKLRRWFLCGNVVTLLTLVPAVVILVKAFCSSVRSLLPGLMNQAARLDSGDGRSNEFFQNAVPNDLSVDKGLTLIAAIGVSTMVHEFGHALAALILGCPLLGWGFLFIGITPAAFVEIPTDYVEDLRKARESLTIMCAGVWHNIVLSAAAFAVATFLLPHIIFPAFVVESGVFVSKIAEGSPLSSRAGLQINDKVIALNGFTIRTLDDLSATLRGNQVGICLRRDSPSISNAPGMEDCCRGNASSSLCFRKELHSEHRFSCIPVRGAFEAASGRFCSLFSGCERAVDECWRPVLGEENERLLQFSVVNVNLSERKVFFVGKPDDVFRSVVFEDCETNPRFSPRDWVKRVVPASVSSAFAAVFLFVANFLHTTASVSLTLAYFNALPCFFTDGARIWSLLVDTCFKRHGSKIPRIASKLFNYFVWAMNFITVGIVLLTLSRSVS